MKGYMKVVALSLGLLTGGGALAATASQQLGICMVDTLNGKERKQLAKWIFLSMGAHPDIKRNLNATSDEILKSNQYVGKLVTRLLTEDCPKELFAASQSDPLAVQKAFEAVGQSAMQELMSNQATMNALTQYSQFTDEQKIMRILSK